MPDPDGEDRAVAAQVMADVEGLREDLTSARTIIAHYANREDTRKEMENLVAMAIGIETALEKISVRLRTLEAGPGSENQSSLFTGEEDRQVANGQAIREQIMDAISELKERHLLSTRHH